MTSTTKKCKSCKKDKPLDAFWKTKGTKDGRQYVCIECSKAHQEKLQEKRDSKANANPEAYQLSVRRYLLRIARRRAKDAGTECSIKADEIPWADKCPVLGVTLRQNTGHLDRYSFSLDRVDSSAGYVKENVRIVSWQFNNLKSNMTLDQVERFYLYMKGEL